MARVKPVIKLPRTGMPKHPAIVTYEKMRDEGLSMRDFVGKHTDMSVQALHDIITRARKNRDFIVPSHRIPILSRYSGIAPYYFDPILWPNVDWKFGDERPLKY